MAVCPQVPGLLAGAPGGKPSQGLGGSSRTWLAPEAKGQLKAGCRGRQGPAPTTQPHPHPHLTPTNPCWASKSQARALPWVPRAMGATEAVQQGEQHPLPHGEGPCR